MQITEKDFGQGYHLISIENESGFHLSVTDLGARIVSLGPVSYTHLTLPTKLAV